MKNMTRFKLYDRHDCWAVAIRSKFTRKWVVVGEYSTLPAAVLCLNEWREMLS